MVAAGTPVEPAETLGWLTTIQFQSPRTTTAPLAIRHWYHVPRKGDQVDIPGVTGMVTHVCWSDDKVVVVMDR